ncbi:MAG: helix-turn-helix domain-containing protein [Bacteriovorax sp.]|nr:helix-turn-helix domain-containing protein [Bacteriovorax sp.]
MVKTNKVATYFMNKNGYNSDEQNNAHSLFNNLIWITTEEASEFLRKSTHAVRQMVYKGKIHARKFHGRLYFNKLELNELIDSSHY